MSALAIATLDIAPHDSLSVVPEAPRKKTLNEKGYVRIWYGADRGKYEHRVVMRNILQKERICADYVFPSIDPKSGLPEGMVVHHINHIRDDNRPSNLMLMDKVIHDALSLAHQQYISKFDLPAPAFSEDEEERVAIQNERLYPVIDAVKFWEDLNQDKPVKRPVGLLIPMVRPQEAAVG